jgi:hypothetical protein
MRFEQAEVALLGQLFDELDALLEPTQALASDDDVQDRLFPPAYDDDAAATEFRELTEDALRSERRERIQLCRADLADSAEVDLTDPDTTRRWLQVLNDLRLVHGTRLGITDDDDPGADPVDPDDPTHLPRFVYYWLSGVQDLVVRAVMG